MHLRARRLPTSPTRNSRAGMCGRYALYGPQSRLRETFGVDAWPEFADHYNIAPSLAVPVIRHSPEGHRVAHCLRWGLVPHWAKDAAIGAKLNNARAESVADKPSFRNAYRKRRCLIPASGYYEWQEVPGQRKQPWFISMRGEIAMAMGGLWESWVNPNGEVLRSFCVVTTAPNEIMQPIHERMPVIVAPEHWERWLDPAASDVADLLAPANATDMQAWPVSAAVSNARHQGADCIIAKPVPDPEVR
jgi:putative SOS response-associated peptidase YedK